MTDSHTDKICNWSNLISYYLLFCFFKVHLSELHHLNQVRFSHLFTVAVQTATVLMSSHY